MVVGIIGAGASGMAAALSAAENPACQVVLLERQARVGRKLLATGNGRCNLTNRNLSPKCYHGDTPEFPGPALMRFGPEETLEWFRTLGLVTVTEDSGRVYPYSDQANSVVDVLRFALRRENLTLRTGFEVERVRRTEGGFSLEGAGESLSVDRLIVACGGIAGSRLGGSLSGYKLLRSLGHHCTRLRPALVQVKTGWSGIAGLKGVRANCKAEILRDGRMTAQSTGEIQFTECGLSGPVMFEISRDVCQGPGLWQCRMDFLPDWSEEALTAELLRRRGTDWNGEDLLTGILHNRLGRVLAKAAGIPLNGPIAGCSEQALLGVCRTVKGFTVDLTEPLGMDSAQVTAGGIVTAEFDPRTMESRLVPGLYACGEVLDVDGDCGGYNLQWAWSSGRLAGLHCGKERT